MGRWFPLILALLIIGLIFTVGFLFGFRIKYAPELKNDWDAISGVAAWVGIVVSIASCRFVNEVLHSYTEEKESRTCLGERQLRGRIGKLL